LSSTLNKSIVVVESLGEVLHELKAIGRNLNQLTTLCNMGKIQVLDLGEIKLQFGDLIERISQLKVG